MSEPVIVVDNLVKRYGATVAVDGIGFTVERGTTAALLGGNGAGKTTTLSILLGLLLPSEGSVRILGENMLRHRYRVLPRINFSSPYADLPHRLTVRQNLLVFARLYGLSSRRERIARLAVLRACAQARHATGRKAAELRKPGEQARQLAGLGCIRDG